ncbi:hypothetical protein HNR40_006828 [Nonomuraea endophytica]|uniref:Uncharacterized protein n=1 Tax=Nonomuraea endophytica TaxID=714136 RepID=A0A7W8AAP1_9ACTN|nr:hypothetical protein [Nonomuraea endophytica]
MTFKPPHEEGAPVVVDGEVVGYQYALFDICHHEPIEEGPNR